MSVGQTTLDLWRRAPAWRFSLIGAIVATVLMLVMGRNSPSPPPTTGTSSSSSSQSVASTSSGSSQFSGAPSTPSSPAPQQQCGPQGQTVVQAPIVVSSTGQVPSNVQGGTGQVQSQGMPGTVQARFVQFSTQVDAARVEPREGERCVKMRGALDKLEPPDYAYADCFQDGEDKLIAAQACSTDLESSETRFERLAAAFNASREDNSAEKVEELARARQRMIPFDETRERWNLNDEMVAAGDRAVKSITDSDARIAVLKTAGIQAPQNTAELEQLADAAKLTALDRARLSAADQSILALADQAKETLSASDTRLATLVDSLAGDPSQNEATRAQLIAALSALTELDLQRATATQQAAIEQGRQTAGEFAVSDLVTATRDLDLGSAEPAVYQRLRELLLAVEHYGGQVEPDSPAARAVETAREADARLARSDRHIANMHDIVQRVEQGGPAALSGDVLRVHKEIEPFDLARMADEDLQVYRQLESAREITLATKSQRLTREVPLFVGVDKDDALTQLALDKFREGLREAGFNLVPAEEQSAVSVVLRRSDVTQKSVRFSGSTLDTAEVSLSVSGKWTFAGESISVPSAKGDAAGSDFTSLQREAVEEAVEDLVERFKEATKEVTDA